MTVSPQRQHTPFSEDHILGGRILLRQPQEGYRVAVDPVLLAASLNVTAGDTILDVGSGVGAAALSLAARCPDVRITGVELQRELVRFAHDNLLLNQMRDRVEILFGDLTNPPPRLAAGTFTHVMANPPYYESDAHRLSPNMLKAASNQEGSVGLDQWVRFCLLMVKPKGTITMIHHAERMDEILACFYGKIGDIRIFPFWPSEGKEAKRVIIQGVKNAQGRCVLHPGMMLHQKDGRYTLEAEAILRHGQSLTW